MHCNKNTNKAITLCGLWIVLAVVILLVSCKLEEAPPPPAPEVSTVTVQPQRVVLTTELPGRISAYLVAEVRPQVSGIVQKRLFAEGGDVKAGEVLYQIDPSLYQAAHDNAMAALVRAEANVLPLRLRAERYKELVAEKAVSRQDYDDAAAALKQAEAEVEVNKAAVEAARINLAYTRITAPISGRIGKSNITVGALATAHQSSALATIQQLDPLYVDVPQSTTELLRLQRRLEDGRLHNGGKNQSQVRLILEDNTMYPFEGTLQFRDVSVDTTTGSVILRMVFPNPKGTLLPGMFVRAVVKEGVNDQAILIPQQAVSRDPKGNPMALIVDAESKVEQRMLSLDRAIGNEWLVASGVAPGDRLVIEGVQKVQPGVFVKVVPLDAGRHNAESEKGSKKPNNRTDGGA